MLENKINQMGAVDLLGFTQTVNELIAQHEEAKGSAWRIRMPGTAYKAGDKVIVPGVGNFDKVLRCETAGTTADAEFPEDYNALEIGDVIADGTVEWGVINLATAGGGSTGGAVTSVNGKTGAVILTAANVGAVPESHATGNNAHKALFDSHRAEKASASASGHVQVDGETIISEDGVIKSLGGLAIGSIFSFPASVPPEGAYLLNGQTIANCSTLYPKFWEWVNTAGVRIIDNATYEAELASAGVCGGFVVNTAAGSVRLPHIVNGTLWGADSTNVGKSLAAGLPNITGTFDNDGALEGISGAFSEEPSTASKPSGDAHSGSRKSITFNASKSNAIYGASTTVQPPAVRVSLCIQVFNVATALSEQESANLASLMQTKAQTDLGNVTANIDFIIKHEEAADGSWWYDLYRNGKVVQGGKIAKVSSSKHTTVTFPVEMADTNYFCEKQDINNYAQDGVSFRVFALTGLSETGMDVYCISPSDATLWRVEGKAATE